MKRLLIGLVAVIAMLAISVPAMAETKTFPFGITDTLAVATTADTVETAWMNIADWDYVGCVLFLDVTAGGSAGAGVVTIEGRLKEQTAEAMWFINMTDSLDSAHSIAVSSTADLVKYFVLSAQPFELKTGDPAALIVPVNLLPYDEVRVKIVDTNWNAAVDISGYWIMKR